MRFFRSGYWQKALTIFLVFLEIVLLVVFAYLVFMGGLSSQYAIWAIVGFWALSFFISVVIVNSASENEYKIGWLFLIAAIPFFGFIFYLIFAHKFRTRRKTAYGSRYRAVLTAEKTLPETYEGAARVSPGGVSIARFIENVGAGRLFANSEVSYYPLGDDCFPEMLRQLSKAKHYIYIEYFIIKPGYMWDSILGILKEKVQEGVDVKVIYDDVGNLGATPVDYPKTLAKYGIKAYRFCPIRPFIDVRMNNRNHRKIMVIDGHTAFTGGINLADEYINVEERFGHWKDNAIMVKGKAVFGYTLLFLRDYEANFGAGKITDLTPYFPEDHIDEDGGFPATDGYVVPYGDIPYDQVAVGEEVYISILSRAKRYVYISTPYFLPSEKLMDAIVRAAHSGVDVRLLVPHKPDKKLVFELTRKNYGPLLQSGAKVYEYTPGFVHQKAFIADDEMATIGTINLDYRSLYLHSENGTLLLGGSVLSSIKRDFLDSFAVSEEITLKKWKGMRWKRLFLWPLLSLFAPLL